MRAIFVASATTARANSRKSKILKFGRTRTMVGIDLYNALNSAAVLTYNNTFVPGRTWLQPQTVLTARLIKFSAEITF